MTALTNRNPFNPTPANLEVAKDALLMGISQMTAVRLHQLHQRSAGTHQVKGRCDQKVAETRDKLGIFQLAGFQLKIRCFIVRNIKAQTVPVEGFQVNRLIVDNRPLLWRVDVNQSKMKWSEPLSG